VTALLVHLDEQAVPQRRSHAHVESEEDEAQLKKVAAVGLRTYDEAAGRSG
jgi:hypothetical protein